VVRAEPERGSEEMIPPCYGEAMKYRVSLQKTEEGYSVSCPGLPGCWSQGGTEEEALENIRFAIEEYLAARDEIHYVRTAPLRSRLCK
jgi:predicted RNase H-like HicB family nuclease